MIAVLDRDPQKIAEIIDYIAVNQDGSPNTSESYNKKIITGKDIQKRFGLTREEYETLLILAMPAMCWRTKARAIAMKKDGVKHIFFIAETKGSMSSMELSAIERAKIACAEKLFNSISTAKVKYHKVATYKDLVDGMNSIK